MATIPEYFEVIFQNRQFPAANYYYNKTEKHLVCPNQSEVFFIALDKEYQIRKLKGTKFGVLWIDQVEEVDKGIFDMACGRVRHAVPFRQKIFTCNPEGGDHYLKELFFNQDIKTKKENMLFQGAKWPIYYGYWRGLNENYLGITAKPLANKSNIADPLYYENLVRTLPREWVLKYVFANWFGKTGLIYPLNAENIIQHLPFESDELMYPVTRFELNDYGISDTSPMVWLNVVFYNGNYYITDEYYHYNGDIQKTAEYVRDLESKFSIKPLYRIGCDRAFQREGTSNNLTPAKLFGQYGVLLSQFRIHLNTRRPILQKLFEQGKIKILESECQFLLQELRGLKWNNEKSAPAHAVEALERGLAKHYLSSRRSAREFEQKLKDKHAMRETLVDANYMTTEW